MEGNNGETQLHTFQPEKLEPNSPIGSRSTITNPSSTCCQPKCRRQSPSSSGESSTEEGTSTASTRRVTAVYCHQKTVGLSTNSPEAFKETELESVLRKIKSGTAAGYDNILPEFLMHLGPKAKTWLVTFYTRIIQGKRIPRAWRQAKVIAIPKPGKDPNNAASYRPISLLSLCFKLLERLILQRISPDLDKKITVEQAGFRQGRSTCDQVLALTTFIKNGFHSNIKTGTVFLNQTAALTRFGMLVCC